MRTLIPLLAVPLLLTLAPLPAPAEEDGVAEARKRMREGRLEEARSLLRALVKKGDAPAASILLAGLLAPDAIARARDAAAEPNRTKRAALRAEARRGAEEIARLTKAYRRSLAQALAAADHDPDQLPALDRGRLQQAGFLDARLAYVLAGTWREGRPERKAGLGRACALFENYLLDWDGYLSGYEATLYLGRVLRDLGRPQEALDHFRLVAGLDATSAGREQKPLVRGLVLRGWHRILETLNGRNRHARALEEAAKMEARAPWMPEAGVPGARAARLARVEKGRALGALGRYAEAVDTLLAAVRSGGNAAGDAVRLLGRFSRLAPGAHVEAFFLQGEVHIRHRRYPEALVAFEETIRRATSPAQRARFAPRAWHQMGLAYAGLERFAEAGLAFGEGERLVRLLGGLPENELAATCAYRAYSAFKRQYRLTGAPEMKKALAAWRRRLVGRYGSSPWARQIKFFAAQDLMQEGDHEEALRLFEAVPRDSDLYWAARARMGRCAFALARLDRAAAILQRVLDAAGKETGPGGNAQSLAAYYLGRTREAQGEPAAVVAALRDYEKRFPRARARHRTAAFLRCKAYAELERPRDVLSMIDLLRADAGGETGGPYLVPALRLAASLHHTLAGRAEKEKDAESTRELRGVVADLLAEALSRQKAPSLSDRESAASALFLAGRHGEAARQLARALQGMPAGEARTRLLRKLALSHERAGQWADALAAYEELAGPAPRGALAERLAVVRGRRGDELWSGGRKEEALALYDRALDLYGEILRALDQDRASWWRFQCNVWEILYRKGLGKRVLRTVAGLRRQYPDLGGKETKRRILHLVRRIRNRPEPR